MKKSPLGIPVERDPLGPAASARRERVNLPMLYLREHFGRYRLFWLLFAAVLFLDQLTKILTVAFVPPPVPGALGVTVIPNFFTLIHVYNKGAAFSILTGYGWVLVLLAVGSLWAMFHWRERLELRRRLMQWIFGMLAGGVFGNVIDRIFRGHVVDFLDFRLPFPIPYMTSPDGHWPAFNVADMGICAGVGLYLCKDWLLPHFRRIQEARAAKAAAAAEAEAETGAGDGDGFAVGNGQVR
ncbi:MAG: signal peptidase II [Puniceicoccales bacterium]|jgi:signal peptidase II|nr:signal peptidase II [Puniceicoccales bacterium]